MSAPESRLEDLLAIRDLAVSLVDVRRQRDGLARELESAQLVLGSCEDELNRHSAESTRLARALGGFDLLVDSLVEHGIDLPTELKAWAAHVLAPERERAL